MFSLQVKLSDLHLTCLLTLYDGLPYSDMTASPAESSIFRPTFRRVHYMAFVLQGHGPGMNGVRIDHVINRSKKLFELFGYAKWLKFATSPYRALNSPHGQMWERETGDSDQVYFFHCILCLPPSPLSHYPGHRPVEGPNFKAADRDDSGQPGVEGKRNRE